MVRLTLIATFVFAIAPAQAQVLNHRALLEAQTFWQNRDFDWFVANIPFFESPDAELDTTYYYRWELVTRHLCYGSPNSGYSFTEFSDRPFWSGAYGAISCPAGHQIYEARWLRQPQYVQDYLRYWFHTPGAQPRRYSFWAADAAWATHLVQSHHDFTVNLLPDLIDNFDAWKRTNWVAEKGLFWQLGHDDGMEFDINAQQTKDILRGGQSLRPSFNAYMWADARAIAEIADLAGDEQTAQRFREFAEQLQDRVHELLWDPNRNFFFPMSNQRHEKDGYVVEPHSLTYQTGKFAGSPHGRELHGYVPWAFSMVKPGYEEAWKFLMDPDCFDAPYGPTTVERNDPLFVLKDGCCWWSGQSWPFATTQTLKAFANLLHHYEQSHVTRKDYWQLLRKYALTHRKDGKPYIAEAVHPDTGSWRGHDFTNRSEHYFHSGFTDLVITGLVGLQPSDSDTLVIDPLAPLHWDYFALDSLPYRGRSLSILWDAKGTRYGKGPGLHVLVDEQLVASAPMLARLEVALPPVTDPEVMDPPPPVRFNYAVNNDGDWYPRLSASQVGPNSSLAWLQDGQVRYDIVPTNRWTSVGSHQTSDWVEVDFGTTRPIDMVKLYLLDDHQSVLTPQSFELRYHDGEDWKTIPAQRRSPELPRGRQNNTIQFPAIPIERLRIVLHHQPQAASGLSEVEAWGAGTRPYLPPPPPKGNIATNEGDAPFPRANASFSDQYGGQPERAIDGKIVYLPESLRGPKSVGIEPGIMAAQQHARLCSQDDRSGRGWRSPSPRIDDPARSRCHAPRTRSCLWAYRHRQRQQPGSPRRATVQAIRQLANQGRRNRGETPHEQRTQGLALAKPTPSHFFSWPFGGELRGEK